MNDHDRAQRLIVGERIERLATTDVAWFEAHVALCPECAAEREATADAIGALRSMQIEIPPSLAARTYLRVSLHAERLREQRRGGVLVWTCCVGSWILGAFSAPYVWRGFEWMGAQTGAPEIVWETGFVLWWGLPALIATAVLLIERRGSAPDWSGEGE